MNVEWVRTVAPAQEPISLNEAKLQAKITHTNEDSLLRSYIVAAREAAENYLSRGLYTQTWQANFDCFGEVMWLPMAAPLQSVSSVQYYDADGNLQTLATSFYTVDLVSRPGRIVRAPFQIWPQTRQDVLTGAVMVTYVVGWTSTTDIPERIKQGIRMYVSYLDADREGMAVEADSARKAAESCWTDRVMWIPPKEYREGW